MMEHRCHAIGCRTLCEPRMLMCRSCWKTVPKDLQKEVYRTVKMRGPAVDETWAPWWRAQARAVAVASWPGMKAKQERYVSQAGEVASMMEGR